MDIVTEANSKAPLVRPHTEFVLIYYLTMPDTWKGILRCHLLPGM